MGKTPVVGSSQRQDQGSPSPSLPRQMRAAVLLQIPSDDLKVAQVAAPSVPARDELLVRVEACGICGTDLHFLNGESFRPPLPFVPGHEPAGTVVTVGRPALKRWLGKRVTATIFSGCGDCPDCSRGDERLCVRMRSVTGLHSSPGAYAEYLVIKAAHAVAIPAGLSSRVAASLADAGPTATNAVRTALARRPMSVAVIGGGPVGFLAAELLRLESVPVVVVEPAVPRRNALAGIDHLVLASVEELSESVDAVIDCSGSPAIIPWATGRLTPRGTIVAVGFPTLHSLDLIPVVRKELAIFGIRSGSREDLVSLLRLAADGQIRLPEIKAWPLERINQALAALRQGQIGGKAVIELEQSRPRSPGKLRP